MKILLSPAKRLEKVELKVDVEATENKFLDYAEELIAILKDKTVSDVAALMKLSQNLSELNVARFQSWSQQYLRESGETAIQLLQGDAYKALKVSDFDLKELEGLQDRLLIISGLYGFIRPFDKILPYRLEMGTKLENSKGSNLYHFWKDILTDTLNQYAQDEPVVVLASKEYSKAIDFKKVKSEVFTFDFLQEKSGQFKNIAIYSKQARGLMTRFIVKNNLDNPQDLLAFDYENYAYSSALSKENHLVFCR